MPVLFRREKQTLPSLYAATGRKSPSSMTQVLSCHEQSFITEKEIKSDNAIGCPFDLEQFTGGLDSLRERKS